MSSRLRPYFALTTIFTTLILCQTFFSDRPLGFDSSTGKYTISGPGLRASFIPYGASITNLFINDTSGIERDIVAGYDDATSYALDKSHPHLGGVPGRYANRIKNSTFMIDGSTYHVLPNEHPTEKSPNGANTLHGGPKGWDWREWEVVRVTTSTITFSIVDSDRDQGFPGEVVSYVTYSLGEGCWDIRMVAVSMEAKTPIMLSSHVYWNLDGWQNPDTPHALNHTLHMPYARTRIGTDAILVPDGDIVDNESGSVNDFHSQPKQIGANISNPDFIGNCGRDCVGYDTCYIHTFPPSLDPSSYLTNPPVAVLSSAFSGIAVSVHTSQPAFQIYSCGGQNGSMPLKTTQGLQGVQDRPRTIQQHGCVVMEVEDWIDGINHPEWGREKAQIFGPEEDPYILEARYVFDVGGKRAGT